MQIVLLEDMKALGKKDQIVGVNDDYAGNFILPKRLGVEANSKNLNDLKFRKANDDRIAAEQLAAVKELGAKLNEFSATLTTKVGEGGRASGSASSKETGKAIGDQLGTGIGKKETMLNDSIKSAGSFEVLTRLHKEATAKLAIKVAEA